MKYEISIIQEFMRDLSIGKINIFMHLVERIQST